MQEKLTREKQFETNVTPREYPKMQIEEHIRLVKKKKHRLVEQLR